MIIKVCGMRHPENIRQVATLNPTYMGFIFYPASKRYVDKLDNGFLKDLNATIHKTGVFVNEDIDTIVEKVKTYHLDAVQLHGDETAEFLGELRDRLTSADGPGKTELIKAFGISNDFDFSTLQEFEGLADKFLFDTKTEGFGGSGKTFDWTILSAYQGKSDYLLSGGLSPENIEQVNAIEDPRFVGVDLNSKFETEPGYKDLEKLKLAFKLLVPQG